jgi:SpoVK/Ycf46/Vps4 family AAA+-type ATPase
LGKNSDRYVKNENIPSLNHNRHLHCFYFHFDIFSGSEKLVRGLFAEAEAELAACNGDATRSALHVVVIDEIDAVFRRRSAGEDSGEQTRVRFLL